MILASPGTLLLAALVASPALYQAFVTSELDVTTALFRYLIAVIVCGLMLSVFKGLTGGYHQRQLDARREAAAAAAAAEAADAEALEEFGQPQAA